MTNDDLISLCDGVLAKHAERSSGKPTIEELERLLKTDAVVHINTDGSVRAEETQVVLATALRSLLLQPQAVPDELLQLSPGLAVCITEGNDYYGWLFRKHPDGQWVTSEKASDEELARYKARLSAAPQPAPDEEARPHKKEFMRNAEGRIAYGWSKQDEEGGFHVEAWAPDWMTVTYLAQGWFLPYEKVNELQANSIAKTIDTAKAAHHTDLSIRINGEYRRFEADWVKHLVYVQPLQQQPTPPASVSEDKP